MKNSLQTKVMVLIFLLAVIPLGIVGFFSTKTADGLIMSLVRNQLANVADDKAHLLERWLAERRADLLVLAGSSIIESMEPGEITRYLHLVSKHYDVYRGITVIALDGKVIARSGGFNSCEGLGNMSSALSSGFFQSGISLRPGSVESSFCMAAPIFFVNGGKSGLVCATVGTAAILKPVLQVNLGKTGECYLVNRDGAFLAHKESNRILNENIAQSGSFANIFATEANQLTYLDYRGIEVIGVSRRVPGTDWYLVVEQDRDEAFSKADQMRRYILIIMVFSIFCAVFLAWSIARYLVRPIRRLSAAANHLAKGEYDSALVRTGRRDEIGALYHAFNDMASQLRQKQVFLEKTVDQRESELHETDIMLQQSRLAAARSMKFSALGRLGAGVAHEIRTPLTSIKLFLESVQSEIEISHEYAEDFSVAMQQIKRMENTINRFLEFAKPQELLFSTVDLSDMVEGVLSVVKPMANKQECSINVIAKDEITKVRGDKKLLEELCINLIINSLEAMDAGGRLEIRISADRRLLGDDETPCVRLDFEDTGQGIALENIANVFDPFYTTKTSGTGLGLSLVHSAVQRHGGTVAISSAIGMGTVVSVYLPVEPKKDFHDNA